MKKKVISLLLAISVLFSSCRSSYNVRNWASQDPERNEYVCPRCGSDDVLVELDKAGFDVGASIIGGVLLFPVGLLFGFIGSNNTVIMLKCKHCGYDNY